MIRNRAVVIAHARGPEGRESQRRGKAAKQGKKPAAGEGQGQRSQIRWENGRNRLYIWCATAGGAMDIYNAWFDLKPGVSDTEFSDRLAAYMEHLKADGVMQGWRLTRRKLGLSAAPVGEFHLMMEFSGLAQLDRAFNQVGSRR